MEDVQKNITYIVNLEKALDIGCHLKRKLLEERIKIKNSEIINLNMW